MRAGHVSHPTPYPDVNAVLQILLSSVQTILGQSFVGMYLSGSLASGDFDPHSSDIDFVVGTTDELADETFSALASMHLRIAGSGLAWATKLEGSYIPRHALRRYDPAHARHPSLDIDDGFRLDQQGSDGVIQRYTLREHGVVLAGPVPDTLIDPIRPDDLRRAVLELLRGWWSQQCQDPVRLHRPGYQEYAVLTMCRALYTLRYGGIVSKPSAARWAQTALGESWAPLIERAAVRRSQMQSDSMNETLGLIRYTLERAEEFETAWDSMSDPC